MKTFSEWLFIVQAAFLENGSRIPELSTDEWYGMFVDGLNEVDVLAMYS